MKTQVTNNPVQMQLSVEAALDADRRGIILRCCRAAPLGCLQIDQLILLLALMGHPVAADVVAADLSGLEANGLAELRVVTGETVVHVAPWRPNQEVDVDKSNLLTALHLARDAGDEAILRAVDVLRSQPARGGDRSTLTMGVQHVDG